VPPKNKNKPDKYIATMNQNMQKNRPIAPSNFQLIIVSRYNGFTSRVFNALPSASVDMDEKPRTTAARLPK
jgi:hypothetical protein